MILCGLRNGAIVTVDSRERRESLSGRLITHRIPYASSDKKVVGSNKEWFKVFFFVLEIRIKDRLEKQKISRNKQNIA